MFAIVTCVVPTCVFAGQALTVAAEQRGVACGFTARPAGRSTRTNSAAPADAFKVNFVKATSGFPPAWVK